jgi:hypothetical protein
MHHPGTSRETCDSIKYHRTDETLTPNTVIEERAKEKLKTDKKEGIPHVDPKTIKDVRSSKMTSRRKYYQTSSISNRHIKK